MYYSYTNTLKAAVGYSSGEPYWQYKLAENHLYGSSRVGLIERNLVLVQQVANTDSVMYYSYLTDSVKSLYRGEKRYELSNHPPAVGQALGNVLAVVYDRKMSMEANSDNIIDFYHADLLSVSDYYPFGMQMMARSETFGSKGYRFAFQGQEGDDEIAGEGNSYTAEFWHYDSRLGRRFNVDPIFKEYESPYACFANNPIWFIDPNGADSTTYLYSALDKDGNPEYNMEQLQAIADQSEKIDRLNGINYTKFKVTTLEEIKTNKDLNLNPLSDLIYGVTSTGLKSPGSTYRSLPFYTFQGKSFIGGDINPEAVGGSMIDAGNVLSHERIAHGYRYITQALFSSGQFSVSRQEESALGSEFGGFHKLYNDDGTPYEGSEKVYYGVSNIWGNKPYTVLRVQETYHNSSVQNIHSLFGYGSSVNVYYGFLKKSLGSHDYGGSGLINSVYTGVLKYYFKGEPKY